MIGIGCIVIVLIVIAVFNVVMWLLFILYISVKEHDESANIAGEQQLEVYRTPGM